MKNPTIVLLAALSLGGATAALADEAPAWKDQVRSDAQEIGEAAQKVPGAVVDKAKEMGRSAREYVEETQDNLDAGNPEGKTRKKEKQSSEQERRSKPGGRFIY